MNYIYFKPNLILEVDPCNTYEWLPYSEYRGTLCPSRPYREICDQYLTANWFRVKGDAKIVTEKVNLYHCATTNPIWMRGKPLLFLFLYEKNTILVCDIYWLPFKFSWQKCDKLTTL